MKLLSYGLDHHMEPRLAFSLNGYAIDVMRASLWMKENYKAQDYLNLPSSMSLLLQNWEQSFPLLENLVQAFHSLEYSKLSIYDRPVSLPETDIVFFAPVPNPPSLRYFSAFSETRGFRFGNTQTLLGNNQPVAHSSLTLQGEMCAVMGGKDTNLEIAGYCIANNWINYQAGLNDGLSLGLATSLGPYLVSADELEGHKLGNSFSLDMQIRVNGKAVSESRFRNMTVGFEEMIRSAGPTHVQAGDIFCSGSPADLDNLKPRQADDQIEIEIQVLGTLTTPPSPIKTNDTFPREK